MNINTHALQQIRQERVELDPLIPHPHQEEWLESTPSQFLELITDARNTRIDEAPLDTPIQKATWPEATVFCFTRSMDAGIDQHEHLGVYQYCFDQMLQDQMETTFPELIPASMEIVTTDAHRDLADRFREFIATAQHRVFIDELYNTVTADTSDVPKAFWSNAITTEYTSDNATGTQSALTQY